MVQTSLIRPPKSLIVALGFTSEPWLSLRLSLPAPFPTRELLAQPGKPLFHLPKPAIIDVMAVETKNS